MQALNRHSSVPLYRQVADMIERAIAAGELAPGDRLPVESRLAEQHGVNRLTVRQALADLSARGLIHTVHGRGSFVSHAPIRHTISGDREASLTRAMRDSGHEVRQQLLRAQRDDDDDARRALRTRGHLRRFDLLRFVDEVPWTVTRMWLSERRFRTLDQHWGGDSSLYEALDEHYGIRMRRAHRTIWSEPAGPVDGEHLLVPVGAPLLVMAGLNVTADGDPVAVVEHRGRGDRVQFTVRFDDA
jgi:DNA-binding GntR family transcriptional regulator